MKRKHPEVDSFTDLYQLTFHPNKLLSQFITGHITIEFLLRKIIGKYDSALTATADNMRHAQLIDLVFDIGKISKTQKTALKEINKIRNRFAHEITFCPSLHDLTHLFKKCEQGFTDLTDGIRQGLGELASVNSLNKLDEWVIPELFIQIAYDLHEEYISMGGDFEEFSSHANAS